MQIVRIAWLFTLLIIAATFGGVPTAQADLLISCGGCSSTVLGGTLITAATSLAPPAFMLSRNPNDNSGLPKLYGVTPVVLIPDNAPNGANLSFTELVRQGSTPIAIGVPICDFACSFPALGLAAEWASPGSDLLSYFGDFLAAGPSVAFDALIAATQAVDQGAHGYFVYVPVSAAAASFAPGNDPSVEFSAIPAFPPGSVFAEIATGLDPVTFAFLPNVPGYDSSGSLNSLILPGSVPEPSTWALVLIGFAGVGFAVCRKTSKVGRAIA
jgi:PEP-CTERM motif